MDPELAQRLRRYGEQVDQAALAAQARRPGPTASPFVDATDELATVVPFVATVRNRRFRVITAAAAAAIVVLAGAAVAWRVGSDDDMRPADSGPSTVASTAQPATTATAPTTTTVVATTVSPLLGPGETTSSTTSSTTTNPATASSGTRPSNTIPGSSPTCPNGYHPYDASYPIRACDSGPAVRLIQQRVAAPEADGYFGPATRQSVRVFQQVNGLEVDGLVGPDTWAAMFPGGAPGTDTDGDGIVEPWEVP